MPTILDPRRPRRLFPRWIAKDLAVVLLILGSVELVLQLRCPQYKDRNFDHELTGNHPIGLNEQGLRGATVPYRQEGGRLRVLALGDSTTFGTGLAVEATWPAQLSTLGGGEPLSYVNAGKPGASVGQMVAAYEAEWHKYGAQVVILALSNNMISLEWLRRNDEQSNLAAEVVPVPSASELAMVRARRLLHRFCLPSLFGDEVERLMYLTGVASHNIVPEAPYGPFLAFGWRQIGSDPGVPGQAWDVLATKIAELSILVRSHDAELHVTMLPSRFQLSDDPSDNEKRVPVERFTMDPVEKAQNMVTSRGVKFVDVLGALKQRRLDDLRGPKESADLYLTADFTHLDEEGSRVVAEQLYAELAELSEP